MAEKQWTVELTVLAPHTWDEGDVVYELDFVINEHSDSVLQILSGRVSQ